MATLQPQQRNIYCRSGTSWSVSVQLRLFARLSCQRTETWWGLTATVFGFYRWVLHTVTADVRWRQWTGLSHFQMLWPLNYYDYIIVNKWITWCLPSGTDTNNGAVRSSDVVRSSDTVRSSAATAQPVQDFDSALSSFEPSTSHQPWRRRKSPSWRKIWLGLNLESASLQVCIPRAGPLRDP